MNEIIDHRRYDPPPPPRSWWRRFVAWTSKDDRSPFIKFTRRG